MNHNQSNSVQSFENFATYFENRMMQEDSIGEKKQTILDPVAKISIDQINQFCNKNYQNILPNKLNYQVDMKNEHYLQKNHIKDIIDQYDKTVQLIIQNFLLCKSEETRLKSFDLLLTLAQKRAQQPKYQKLQEFKIPLNLFYNENENSTKSNLFFYAKPQFSLYQTPLLDFFELFREIMRRNHTKDTILNLLHEQFQPLINPHWLPMQQQGSAIRGKFSNLDDNLLLLGLKQYELDFQKIQTFFLKDKTIESIKNRYKNLICKRAEPNLIKRWKLLRYVGFSDQEKNYWQQAINWFGGNKPKFALIQKYFLPERDEKFLKGNWEGCPILLKKRQQIESLMQDINLEDSFKHFGYVGFNKMADIQDYAQLKQNLITQKEMKKIKFDDKNQIIYDNQNQMQAQFDNHSNSLKQVVQYEIAHLNSEQKPVLQNNYIAINGIIYEVDYLNL